MALQQLCGVNVLAYYSAPTFVDSLPTTSVLPTQNNACNMTTVKSGVVDVRDQVALGVSLAAEEDLC